MDRIEMINTRGEEAKNCDKCGHLFLESDFAVNTKEGYKVTRICKKCNKK